MKTKLLFAIFVMLAFFASGQHETIISPAQIGEIKVTPPEFTGINVAKTTNDLSLISSYLMENVAYPDNDANHGSQGTEVVQFTVTAEGNVTDFKVINSVSWEIDQEIIRVLKTTNGMWKPGYNNNQQVDMTKEVSMMFCLRELDKPVGEIFTGWASASYTKGSKALFEKRNVHKALKCFDDGINYLPYDKSLLMLRGICRYELGNKEGAFEDWNRMSNLGCDIDMSDYAELLQSMKGYEDLMAFVKK